MDREIPKEVQRKKLYKQITKISLSVAGVIIAFIFLFSFLQPTLKRSTLNVSKVDRGTIDVSVSASGKVVPAFEEIINSPINSRIIEI